MKSRTATRRWPVRCAPTGPTALSSRSGSSTRRACRSSPATISCTMCRCSILFVDGEENNAEGRAMAHIVGGAQDGNSYELAWLGNMAYENQLANAFTGDKTVVAMLNDTAAAGNSGGGSTFTGNDR